MKPSDSVPPLAGAGRIIELAYAFRGARALMSAVEMGVFSALAAGPLDAAALRSKTGLASRASGDFLDALVALGLLRRDTSRLYYNSPEADYYLDSQKATYIGGIFENLSAREYGVWSSLTAALRSGEPQTGFERTKHFGELYSDPVRLKKFASGMTGQTLPVAQSLARVFPWHNFQQVADIGAAAGCLLVEIASIHPHLKGCGFDLPPLQALFDDHVRRHHLGVRLTFQPGDFFIDPLPTAEVLVLGRVLHNWDLPTKKLLLRKAYDALPVKGAAIVYERFIDDARERQSAALLDSLNMLLMTAGGFDYSAAQGVEWMNEVGFRNMKVEALAAGHSMIVGFK